LDNVKGEMDLNGKNVKYVIVVDVDSGSLNITYKMNPEDMDPVMCALAMVMLGHSIANEMGVDIVQQVEETDMKVKKGGYLN
jgi:hypothetical protein